MADEAQSPTPEGAEDGKGGAETPTPETPAEGKTFTQGDLDRIVEDRLKRERAKFGDYKDLKQKADKLAELEQANKTETEKLAERLSGTEKERDEALAKLTRFEVAAEKKLPAELAELLTGNKEEMEARADVLLQHVKTDTAPDFGGGAREQTAEAKPPEQAHNDLILGITGHLPTQ
jgi:hypothetical protein